jgi:hypothetical protein
VGLYRDELLISVIAGIAQHHAIMIAFGRRKGCDSSRVTPARNAGERIILSLK